MKKVIIVLAVVLIVFGTIAYKVMLEKNDNTFDLITVAGYKIEGNDLSNFDLTLLKRFANNKSNQVVSPLSLKYALGMLSEGAVGNFKTKLDTLLGNYKINSYSNSNVSVANALFVKEGVIVKDSYKTNLSTKFNASVITDSFKTTEIMNNWVKEKTFNMIENAVSNDMLSHDYILTNALSIDMEWINKFQPDDGYSAKVDSYANENVYASVPPMGHGYPYINFNGEKTSSMPYYKLANRYDIVKVLGEENMRAELTSLYNKYLSGELDYTETDNYEASTSGLCPGAVSTSEYVNNYISEINKNYNVDYESTDFNYYIDNDIKEIKKALKTYDGLTLEYVAIMPLTENLTDFIKNLNVSKLNNYLNKLDENPTYEEGYVTKLTGNIPTFELNDTLDVNEFMKSIDLGDMFEKNKNVLSGIADNAYIESVKQKNVISVTNDGIKASSITMVGGAGGGNCGITITYKVPVKEIDLTFDRPFIYLVRDKNTKEIWYMGKLYTPTTVLDQGGK